MSFGSIFRRRGDPRKAQLIEALNENDLLLGHELAWSEIRLVFEAELKKTLPDDVHFEKPRHPHRYMTLALWKYVTTKLTSGELHIYRGVLSGRGQSYRAIADELMSHMIANGDRRGSDNENELFELDEAIREIGWYQSGQGLGRVAIKDQWFSAGC